MSQPSKKPDRGSSPAMPRWVKVLGIAFIVMVLVVVALHFMGAVPWSHNMP